MMRILLARRRPPAAAAAAARTLSGAGEDGHDAQLDEGEVSSVARRLHSAKRSKFPRKGPKKGWNDGGRADVTYAEFVARYDARKRCAPHFEANMLGSSVLGGVVPNNEEKLDSECATELLRGSNGEEQKPEGFVSNILLQLGGTSSESSIQSSGEDETFDSDCLLQESVLNFVPLQLEQGSDKDFEDDVPSCGNAQPFMDLRETAGRIFEVLQQDGPGFNAHEGLDEMQLSVSTALVREVLFRILKHVYGGNKERWAKLTCKFFDWCGRQDGYRHNTSTYNLTLKVLGKCLKLDAMLSLLSEMTGKGLPVTARTFNILICSCEAAGLSRAIVNKIIKSDFYYRPFKNSFTAILYSLLILSKYHLVEWVYDKMLREGHSPDLFVYNVLLRAKYFSNKIDQVHKLIIEMGDNGFVPDQHTYSLLLYILGKTKKPIAAVNLLKHMDEVGCSPSTLHYTKVIDGLSHAGDLNAFVFFFDEMINKGCEPDVVCYTIMIKGFLVAGEFERAEQLFTDMSTRGLLPNVYTYNVMIKGLCLNGRFDAAIDMLKAMDIRRCTPNFSVYSTLVTRLRSAGLHSEADEVIHYMVKKGHYLHLVSRFRGHRRS